MAAGRIVVFVHGWSVRNTETYGGLPARLRLEARRDPSLGLDVRDLWLGKYISFHNEVRIEDIARAFEAAVQRELGEAIAAGRRFACITHSTGGPVVREWLHRYHLRAGRRTTPLSHLIMLAPANFGSALAQLGRSRLARLRTMFEGVEPGFGVLDWLELGSPENTALALDWLERAPKVIGPRGCFPFVLTGATIDRKLYDHVNSYTGEMGSDGVIRVAAANLNFTHVTLQQEAPRADPDARAGVRAPALKAGKVRRVDSVPLAILPGLSHSGDAKGIMRSVRESSDDHPTIAAILACLAVRTGREYARLRAAFADSNAAVVATQRVEVQALPGPFERTYVNDPCSMVVFRVRDDQGAAVRDFEIVLTAGAEESPDALPPRFFIDRQRNRRDPGTVTYYINHARMTGTPAVLHAGKELRPKLESAGSLGLRVVPYPQDGFVHYVPCALKTSVTNLENFVRPYETTIVDVVLRRVVREGVFRLTRDQSPEDFTKAPPGGPIGD
jgi:hypothetical protein